MPKKKKTIIIVCAVIAAVAGLSAWYYKCRSKYTIRGVLSKMSFLSDEQKEALRSEAETQKQIMESTNESAVAVWVKQFKEDYYYTQAMALVDLAASNLELTNQLSATVRAQIETQLNQMI